MGVCYGTTIMTVDVSHDPIAMALDFSIFSLAPDAAC
jgi:hypothetical protein